MKTLSKLWAQMGVGWKVGCVFFLSLLVMKYILGYDHDSRLILAATLAVCYGLQLLSKQVRAPKPDEKKWCAKGSHWIIDEPYRLYENETGAGSPGDPYCLRCLDKLDEDIKDIDNRKIKEFEWELLTEDEREARRMVAKPLEICPRCQKALNPKEYDWSITGSCPMCHEYPFLIGAPMNRGWRELEWASLSESGKQAMVEAARTKIEANFSEWATKGEDGVWRRKDNGEVAESKMTEASLIESAKSRYGWSEGKQ